MELSEYRKTLLTKIHSDAATGGSINDVEAFVNYVSDLLVEAEVLDDDIHYVPFEGVGRRGRKIQIDGYIASDIEIEKQVSLFIVPPLTYGDEIETLEDKDIKKYFSRAEAFIEDAEYIKKSAEESAPAYGLAVDIINKYSDSETVKKYSIFILTEMGKTRTVDEIPMSTINGIPVEYHIWDIKRLHQRCESKRPKEDIVINFKNYMGKGLPCLYAGQNNDYIAYLCNISGTALAELYNRYGSRLLEGNVRSFLQLRGKVNKEIRQTILKQPEMFFAYNNGIAATAFAVKTEKHDEMMYISEVTGLQIVNGGQTTASLAWAFLKDKRDGAVEKIRRIYVPMKLSIVEPEKAQEIIPYIARYANSQNKVSESDLWSTDPFHVRLQGFSRNLITPAVNGKQNGTYWYYERTNGQYKLETYKATDAQKKQFEKLNPPSQKFTKTDLAKYVNTCEMMPFIASLGGEKSFASFSKKVSEVWKKDDAWINAEYFRQIVSMAIIFRQTDKIVKKLEWGQSYKINTVEYTIAKIIYEAQLKWPGYKIDYYSIWKRQGLSSVWEKEIIKISEIVFNQLLIRPDRTVENVTEWAKRNTCWEWCKKLHVELSEEFKNELMPLATYNERHKKAHDIQKGDNVIDTERFVAEYGLSNWQALKDWNVTHKVLNSNEISFVDVALKMAFGRFPSPKQCKRLVEILGKARLEGFQK